MNFSRVPDRTTEEVRLLVEDGRSHTRNSAEAGPGTTSRSLYVETNLFAAEAISQQSPPFRKCYFVAEPSCKATGTSA